MPSFSQQTNTSQTSTRPLKRPLSSILPASTSAIPKKFCKQPDIKRKMPTLPPLPPVQSEAVLAIFAHSTLKSSVLNDSFGDADRLAFIGREALRMAVAEVLYEKRPMLTAVDLEGERDQALSDESYDQWVTQYKMRDKVHCPSELREELGEPVETRHLFDAYVGALQTEKGYFAVKTWIQPLIDPDFDPKSNLGLASYGSNSHGSMGGHTVNPLPPASPPPPLPGNPLGQQGVLLASFNQTAAQRGLKIEWKAEQSGPGHALTWNVECIVGGVSSGNGTGKSKQLAKEEAARQALASLGWATASGPNHSRPFDMHHTPLAQPTSPTQFTPNPSFQPLPTRDRFDSFKSLALSAPGPSPPSPFFQPLSQPQRLPFSSPPASPHRPYTPPESKYSQSTTPTSSPHASMISVPVPATSTPSNLLSSPGQSSHDVIDLTSSPSPPPAPLPLPPSLPQQPQYPSAQHTTLESALPKTPVCIGRLDVTALIVYPSAYLDISPSEPSGSEPVWGPVRLQYERSSHNPGSEDSVSIRTPNKRTQLGEILPGENFAIIERRVASVLGPMLGKGLIRVDSRIRRGSRHLPVLPLEVLVYTPKGNIAVVGNFLRQSGLLLEHPVVVPTHVLYHNPHNPPSGGHALALMTCSRTDYSGPGGSSSRWSTPTAPGKTVEVQRAQVDELFKNLRGGEELEETEPPPEIGTLLYPHQKKALTFLLEREQEINRGEHGPSLWQCIPNPITGQKTWCHLVTQKELFEMPHESRGAILADDMGLGKTITSVSLIAATLQAAMAFEAVPLVPPKPPIFSHHDSDLTAEHFAGRVWGMPSPSTSSPPSSSSSAKAKAKEAKAQDLAEELYARACRIKCRSRATLVVCPLSTVANWEDQFREHWGGTVRVLGGSGSCTGPDPAGTQTTLTALFTNCTKMEADPADDKSTVTMEKKGASLRVYVYHGNARRLDPTFLADFDVVITTYSTLATEYSKQTRSLEDGDDVASDSGNEANGKRAKTTKTGKRKRPTPNGTEATSPLQSVHWFRVILDEAHSIKELNTVACRASCDLMADRRLCLTGTPVQNKLDDVFALIKFLKLSPLDDKATWTEFIGTPVKYGQPLGVARLQTIMGSITLRRTKESKTPNGQRILNLPPRRDELRYLKFDAQEQELYDRFFNESKAEFHELSHKNEVMKNYVGILQKILRLRQICDDQELVKGKGLLGDTQLDASYEETVAAVTAEGITPPRAAIIFALLREAATTQCSECGFELCPSEVTSSVCSGADGDVNLPTKRSRKAKASRTNTRANSPATTQAPRPMMTRCQHVFCSQCFKRKMSWPDSEPEAVRPCPVCQNNLRLMDAVEFDVDVMSTEAIGKKKPGKRNKKSCTALGGPFRPSTKVKALLNDLVQFSKANPHSVNYDPTSVEVQMVDDQGNIIIDDSVVKTVVFSQWTTMLDRVEEALDGARIRYDRLDGTMKREDRSRAMDALKNDPGCEVLLVSLKAGGVGLNLTAAQRVYLMDPYWNPAVENQAVDRIHRLGQTRPVTTVKLIIENSIEARLLEVQKKKTELANMTLGHNFSKQDLMHRRMEELRQLFSR